MIDSDLWVDLPQDELIAEINDLVMGPPEPSREDGWVLIGDLSKAAGTTRDNYGHQADHLVDKGILEKCVWKHKAYYRKKVSEE